MQDPRPKNLFGSYQIVPNALSMFPSLHVCKQKLEPVTKRSHIRVWVSLQLKPLRDDLDRPILQLSVLPSLETKVKVARIFGIDAKGVD